jgi:leucyl/phenylalanyl-tRNA--protein transferase
MPILEFPDPQQAGPEGIIAVGGDLHPESLLLAYQQGIFPWPIEGVGLAWFCPDPRAIIEFADLHIPRSLKKFLKKTQYEWTIDHCFPKVIDICGQQLRKGQQGTWITPGLNRAYKEFYRLGYAHSVEVWEKENLIGGVYGVSVHGVFSAESMFYKKPNASKLALLYLIDHLQSRNSTWMDIQMATPHMRRLGAKEIPRKEFLKKLKKTQSLNLKLF